MAGKDRTELQAMKQLLMLLDKTFKTTRTYGPNNPVAQKFFQQFYNELSRHLDAHDMLLLLIQRSELYYQGEVVYQASSPTENLAFKMHADGIRELAFHKGLTQNDLLSFFEALWGTSDPEQADDDIVTRLWGKNLSTISFVTAEEIIKSSDMISGVLTPQDTHTLNSPVSHVSNIASKEKDVARAGVREISVAAYEISQQELDKLAQEIEAESSRDNVTYILDMLTAMLASETSDDILTKLLDLFSKVLDTLSKQGQWKLLNTIVSLLEEAQGLCPNLSDGHRKQLASLVDSLGRPDRIKAMEMALNANSEGPTEDLHSLLLMLKPHAVPSLCALMANLKHKPHRLMVCEVLVSLAKQNPGALLKGLSDSRWYYVRNLVYIIGKTGNEQLVNSLEPLTNHKDVRVRREVLRAFKSLCPSGKGDRFIALLNDPDEPLRLTTLKILLGGAYTASFRIWIPIITFKSFHDRSLSEKRAVFQAMRQTAGEEIIPYCQQLVTQWFWRNRRKHQEAGMLAAEALGAIGTSAAITALEA
ncbi:MAG: hypothetical protein C4293_18515, partial [Nitrospiraceae bacterium]